MSKGWLLGFWLVVATIVAYRPAWHAGFIWDDDIYVTRNSLLTASDGLQRIWFSTDSPSQYFPLVYTTFRAEHALWGFDSTGYHWVNILLHAANAVLVWRLLTRLSIPGAWFAAAIFALHPVNVESVAWITELKNVQSLFFILLALVAWVTFVERSAETFFRKENENDYEKENELRPGGRGALTPREGHIVGTQGGGTPPAVLTTAVSPLSPSLSLSPSLRNAAPVFYGLALLCYTLALFSKTTACTLPAALLLVLWVKHERVDLRRLAQIAPFVALGLAMGLLTVWWERHHQGTSAHDFAYGPLDRVLIASRAVWFYLSKLAWPTDLTFIYPLWTIDPRDPFAYVWVAAVAAAAAVIFFARRRIGRGPALAAWFYVATLSPVLGFIMLYTFHFSLVADHYQYVASLGPIALAAAAASRLRLPAGLGVGAGAALLLVLGGLTWRQCGMYADIETLWRATLARDPNSYIAHNSLSLIALKKGQVDEAIVHAERALGLQRDSANHALALINLGNARLQQGKIDDAIAHFRLATEIAPTSADAHNNLGSALLQHGTRDEAMAELRQALVLQPGLASAHYNLGSALLGTGRADDAIVHFQAALESDPADADTRLNLGTALLMRNRLDEAKAQFEALLKLKPDSAPSMSNLALILSRQGKWHAAFMLYRKALDLQPDNAITLTSFAWLLATCAEPTVRSGTEALALAERANELSAGRDPIVLRTLAAAYAAAGRFADAKRSIPKAIELAQASGRVEMVTQLEGELKQYEAGHSLGESVQ